MPPLPITPSKVDEGIEKIKQSLSAKWGIRFPVRDATHSPSKRDMSLVEEKILVLIQLLYFRGGALDYAIGQFEENAAQIISKWQFKSYGEPDLLLSLEASKSALKQDFLKKRPALSQKAVTELTENLKHFLNLIADRVKAGEKFPEYVKTKGKNSHFYFQLRSTEIVSDQPIPTNEFSPTKPNISKRQSSLALWLRSRSEPGPAKGGISPAQHPSSSDDYPDHEMADLMVNVAVPTQAADAWEAGESAKLEQRSSSEDRFETPPSTPPQCKPSSFDPSVDKKRSHPDSMQAPPSRNVSRKTSSEKSAQEVSGMGSSRGLSQFSKLILHSQATSTIQDRLRKTKIRSRNRPGSSAPLTTQRHFRPPRQAPHQLGRHQTPLFPPYLWQLHSTLPLMVPTRPYVGFGSIPHAHLFWVTMYRVRRATLQNGMKMGQARSRQT